MGHTVHLCDRHVDQHILWMGIGKSLSIEEEPAVRVTSTANGLY